MDILLGKDMAARRHKILSLRRVKLDIAYTFLEERLKGLDARYPYNQQESGTTPEGDICVRSSNVIQFEGVRSVKQVFDACLFYVTNIEISISEMLGQLTLRDDIDCIDATTSNHQLVAGTDHDVLMELNSVYYGEYIERFDKHNGEEFAIMTTETVEEDELYLYQPHARVRRDLLGIIGVSTYR